MLNARYLCSRAHFDRRSVPAGGVDQVHTRPKGWPSARRLGILYTKTWVKERVCEDDWIMIIIVAPRDVECFGIIVKNRFITVLGVIL